MTPRVYDELFSGVDLLPTLLGLLGLDEPADIDGISHAQNLLASPREMTPVRSEIFSAKAYHDSFDHARAVRTKDYSYIETYHHRPSASMAWDLQTGSSVKVIAPEVVAPQPERELYDLLEDPHETRNILAAPTDEACGRGGPASHRPARLATEHRRRCRVGAGRFAALRALRGTVLADAQCRWGSGRAKALRGRRAAHRTGGCTTTSYSSAVCGSRPLSNVKPLTACGHPATSGFSERSVGEDCSIGGSLVRRCLQTDSPTQLCAGLAITAFGRSDDRLRSLRWFEPHEYTLGCGCVADVGDAVQRNEHVGFRVVRGC